MKRTLRSVLIITPLVLSAAIVAEELIRTPIIVFAANDHISQAHAKNLLWQRLITSTGGGVSTSARAICVPALRSKEAMRVLETDIAWAELRMRRDARPTGLEQRLDDMAILLRDLPLGEAVALLRRSDSPAAEVLSAPAVGQDGMEPLIVESIAVINRMCVDRRGGIRKACEVKVVLKSQQNQWVRTWYGQVFSDDDKWRIMPSVRMGKE